MAPAEDQRHLHASRARPDKTSTIDAEFEELYRSSRDDVYAYVAGLLRDRSAAEDVTAAAFERAYRKRSRFDAAARHARGRGSSGSRATPRSTSCGGEGAPTELETEPADDAPAPGRAGRGGPAARGAAHGARHASTPRERELVALKFFAGLTNAEIADVLGVSESNAGTRLHRTVEKLRRACDEAA